MYVYYFLCAQAYIYTHAHGFEGADRGILSTCLEFEF